MHHSVKIGLLLLAFLLLQPRPPLAGASAEGSHGGEAKSSEKKGDSKKDGGKAENGCITMGPLVVNVLSNKGYRYLRLNMQVMCETNDAAERLVKPDAKEAVILLLSSRMAEELLPPTGKMILRKDLLDCMGNYAGAGKVKGLYFTEFVLQ